MSELRRREETVREYLDNYRMLKDDGEYAKAGEVLWGAVSNLVEAIAWARTGSGLGNYGDQKRFVKELAHDKDEPRLYESYKDIETLHTKGFYERLIDEDEFREIVADAEQYFLPTLQSFYSEIKPE